MIPIVRTIRIHILHPSIIPVSIIQHLPNYRYVSSHYVLRCSPNSTKSSEKQTFPIKKKICVRERPSTLSHRHYHISCRSLTNTSGKKQAKRNGDTKEVSRNRAMLNVWLKANFCSKINTYNELINLYVARCVSNVLY